MHIMNMSLYLQDASRTNNKSQYDKFKESTMESVQACTLRGQFELVKQENPINLSEVSTLRLHMYCIYSIWFIL